MARRWTSPEATTGWGFPSSARTIAVGTSSYRDYGQRAIAGRCAISQSDFTKSRREIVNLLAYAFQGSNPCPTTIHQTPVNTGVCSFQGVVIASLFCPVLSCLFLVLFTTYLPLGKSWVRAVFSASKRLAHEKNVVAAKKLCRGNNLLWVIGKGFCRRRAPVSCFDDLVNGFRRVGLVARRGRVASARDRCYAAVELAGAAVL